MPHVDTIYPYHTLEMYPHLGPKDAYIWDRFVRENPRRFAAVMYDARVGDVPDCPANTPLRIRLGWEDLCRGRVDVIAEDVDNIYVIELKPRARGEAIGQALVNARLYVRERAPVKHVVPTVITDIALPHISEVAAELGVLMLDHKR